MTFERTVYLTEMEEVSSIQYDDSFYVTSELRCCLAIDDHYQNDQACLEADPVEYTVYTYDKDSMTCS